MARNKLPLALSAALLLGGLCACSAPEAEPTPTAEANHATEQTAVRWLADENHRALQVGDFWVTLDHVEENQSHIQVWDPADLSAPLQTREQELETTAFDETAERLASLTAELGGYFESSSVDNRSGDYRWAEYTVRVPSGQYQTFLDQTGELCNVLWSNATQEDVSEAYYDTEGRLRTQQIKLERLQSLLEQAENMEDIITIESAISETEQQIDDLSGTLQHYDALVDYAAVHLTLYEVYQLSDETQAPGGFGQRLGAAFTGGLRSFGDVLEGLVLAAAYGWVWLVLLAAAAAVAVRQVRRRRRRDAQDQHDNPPKL